MITPQDRAIAGELLVDPYLLGYSPKNDSMVDGEALGDQELVVTNVNIEESKFGGYRRSEATSNLEKKVLLIPMFNLTVAFTGITRCDLIF
jgi:hypothetical protein